MKIVDRESVSATRPSAVIPIDESFREIRRGAGWQKGPLSARLRVGAPLESKALGRRVPIDRDRGPPLSLFVSRYLSSCRRCRRQRYPCNERSHCRMWLNPFSWQRRRRCRGRKSACWAAWGGRKYAGRSTRAKGSGPILCSTWSVLRLKWVSVAKHGGEVT